jgi:hypothetical protein
MQPPPPPAPPADQWRITGVGHLAVNHVNSAAMSIPTILQAMLASGLLAGHCVDLRAIAVDYNA